MVLAKFVRESSCLPQLICQRARSFDAEWLWLTLARDCVCSVSKRARNGVCLVSQLVHDYVCLVSQLVHDDVCLVSQLVHDDVCLVSKYAETVAQYKDSGPSPTRPQVTSARPNSTELIGEKSDYLVQLCGIPYDTTKSEIRQFLEGILSYLCALSEPKL